MKAKTQRILINIIGCIAFLSIPIISSPDFNYDLANQFKIPPFQRSFCSYIYLLLFFYLNYYYLIPKFYFNQKKTLFFVLIAVCFILFLIVPDHFFPVDFAELSKNPMFKDRRIPPPNGFHPFDFGGIISFGMIVSLSFLLKLNNQLSEIKTEKLNAEVSYLKAQINPHFLFNTLNSLYALTITKSDYAPEAVLKLSNMMRYVVTESSQDFVPLEKEINYITDYIDLQKLRMDESTNFSFEITGNPLGKSIAPLMLIPFIENAFKYGLNQEEESEIHISIEIKPKQLILNAKNKMVVDAIPEEMKTEKGIENTTKRLDIIYPSRHQLEIKEENNTYAITLHLDLW